MMIWRKWIIPGCCYALPYHIVTPSARATPEARMTPRCCTTWRLNPSTAAHACTLVMPGQELKCRMSNLKSSSGFCFGIVFVCLLFCCCCRRFYCCCCCCCCCWSAYGRICMTPLYRIATHTLVYVWLKLRLCVIFSDAFFSPKKFLVEAVKQF